jgi:hypothetical protein
MEKTQPHLSHKMLNQMVLGTCGVYGKASCGKAHRTKAFTKCWQSIFVRQTQSKPARETDAQTLNNSLATLTQQYIHKDNVA